MILHPETTKRVFHQIADNPIRSEKLGGGGDILGLDRLSHHLVFFLGDVELIQPADHLNPAVGDFRQNCLPRQSQNGTSAQQIVGHQKLSVIIDRLK